MLFKPPEHLSPYQKEQYRKASFRIFNLVIGAISMAVVVVAGVLLYTSFGTGLDSFFEKSPIVERPISRKGKNQTEKIVDGVHLASGFKVGPHWELVKSNCTACHSSKLVIQNRATREGWSQMIQWMQETQGLWDLGKQEGKILDYLATYYAPEEIGRRENLANIEWYILELKE